MPRRAVARRARGVTLIELVVAIAILALGTLALWRSIGAAGRGIAGQAPRVLAQEVAMNRAAELRLFRPGDPALPERVRMGGQEWHLSDTPLELAAAELPGGLEAREIRVSGAGGIGARLVVWRVLATTADPRADEVEQ